ncbi:MAG TPA: hypothetical protein VG268_12340 [Streptosporangiaceae bacterium]|nr:hypothetical protein [Streptosporangiaceae bacterium]
MQRLKARISAIGLAVASGAVAGAALLPATPASAMVVISDPAPSVRVGHTFTVGDWFQQ